MAGILGLTNFYGFALYIFTALSSAATVAVVKCNLDIGKYVPQAHGVSIGAGPVGGGGGGIVLWKGWWALAGLGQENLLGFLLFWIGSYALIHGKSTPASSRFELTKQCTTRNRNIDVMCMMYGTLICLRGGFYLRPPVLGSTGFRGHKAAPIVLPSSLRRLYVEAALRYLVSDMQCWKPVPDSPSP